MHKFCAYFGCFDFQEKNCSSPKNFLESLSLEVDNLMSDHIIVSTARWRKVPASTASSNDNACMGKQEIRTIAPFDS